nr:MAG TPA: UBA-like domain protein [Caudoviricetes sp.]
MEHSEFYIRRVMNYGYTREEAINILDGKNPDGSSFIPLPF